MNLFYTYIYRDPSRKDKKGFPEPIYVGKGQKRRVFKHLTRSDTHPFTRRLQKMKQAGILPEIEIVQALDENHAFFMETCLIQIIGRKDLGQGPLLNLSDGGRGGTSGRIVSKETCLKIKNALTGRTLSSTHRNANVGRIHSPETRAKIAASLRNRHRYKA